MYSILSCLIQSKVSIFDTAQRIFFVSVGIVFVIIDGFIRSGSVFRCCTLGGSEAGWLGSWW